MADPVNAGDSAKEPRLKRLLPKLALSLAIFIIALGGFEAILRLNGYGNLELYQPDPALYWKLKPNQNCFTKVDHKPVHINSHGTRGPEFQLQKPPGTFRILSLGDSRTFGWGLSEAETYSTRLRPLLSERPGSDKRIEVVNAGVNAWSYSQMLIYFRDIASNYQPDVVILAEANLWTQFSEKNSASFVKKFMWRVRLKNFLRRSAIYHYVLEVKLKNFYERYRTKFIPVDPKSDALFKEQQQNDPEAVFRAAIEDLGSLAIARGSRLILLYLPTVDDLGTTNSTVLKVKREVAQKLRIPLVDMTADVQAEGKGLYLEADPVHFNARGNELIARRLAETVNSFSAR